MVGIYSPTGTLWTKALAACALVAAVGLFSRTAEASHIHHATKADIQAAQSWSTFLLANPSVWSEVHAPAFSAQVRSMIWNEIHASNAEVLPMVQYLEWRRSLNPQRFDYYHPNVSTILKKLESQPITTVSAPQTITPTASTPTPTVAPLLNPVPQTILPSVPEPSTILLALGMGMWGIYARRRLQLITIVRGN